jgi:rare lipoprotein A (peptidoglycan hydrolase)
VRHAFESSLRKGFVGPADTIATRLFQNRSPNADVASRAEIDHAAKRVNKKEDHMVSASQRPTRAWLVGSLCGFALAAFLTPAVCQAETTSKRTTTHKVTEPATLRTASHVQIGNASWYGKQHQGRRTANGEQFDARALTAAHPTLPLGSEVRVTNLKNGRWVDVRVNDRGPFGGHRVIDVSQAAAEEIGLKGTGVGRVKIEALRPTPKPIVYHPY